MTAARAFERTARSQHRRGHRRTLEVDRRTLDVGAGRGRPATAAALHRGPARAAGRRTALPAERSFLAAPIARRRLPTAPAHRVGLRDEAAPAPCAARARDPAAARIARPVRARGAFARARVAGRARIPRVDVVRAARARRARSKVARARGTRPGPARADRRQARVAAAVGNADEARVTAAHAGVGARLERPMRAVARGDERHEEHEREAHGPRAKHLACPPESTRSHGERLRHPAPRPIERAPSVNAGVGRRSACAGPLDASDEKVHHPLERSDAEVRRDARP